jgi:nitrilase
VGKRKTFGHTRILTPWGRPLAERPQGNGVVWADLDFEDQDRIRAELPALEHRRL